jgi:glutamine cyclotransferase
VTELDGKVYQLTRDGVLLVYSSHDLALTDTVTLPEVLLEARGICTDGVHLFISVNSYKVYKLKADSYELDGYLTVHQEGEYITSLGELQFVNGQLWAIVNRSHYVVIFNPSDGSVTDWVAFYGLEHDGDFEYSSEGPQMSGIAALDDEILVAGRKWGHYYAVEVTVGYSCDEVPSFS